jgi:ribosomal protein S2
MFLALCDTDAASKLQDLLTPANKKAAVLLNVP